MKQLPFRHLEGLIIRQEDSPYKALNYKALNSLRRIKKLITLQRSITNSRREYFAVRDLNLYIESFILTLLISSTIEIAPNKDLTKHYKRNPYTKQTFFLSRKLKDISSSQLKFWIGPNGCLLNNMIYKDSYDHYLSSCELAYYSCLEQLNSCYINQSSYNNISTSDWNQVIEKSINSLLDDSLQSDYLLYKLPSNLLSNSFKYIFDRLELYSKKIPIIVNWYTESFHTTKKFKSLSQLDKDNDREVSKLLINLAKVALDFNLGIPDKTNLGLSFLLGELPNNWINSFQILEDTVRSSVAFSQLEEDSFESQMVNDLKTGLQPNRLTIKNALTWLYKFLSPPGGLNSLLLTSAVSCLNKAYIITSLDSLGLELYKSHVETLDSSLLNRVSKLLDYTSTLLRSTNIYPLQVKGYNLSKLIEPNLLSYKGLPKTIYY